MTRGWFLLIAAAWSAFAGASFVNRNLPAWWYFEAGELIVANTERGVCPVLIFDRNIKRPFHGEWIVTLRRQERRGFVVVEIYPEQGPGHADYRPDAVLPDPLTFDWWAGIGAHECDWPAGTYQVLTQWTVQPGLQHGFVRATSNPFIVGTPE